MDPVLGGALIYGGVSAANLAYQAWQNRRTESREDNAITRQVADLRRAGLSPLLATGNGAPASSLPAPQVDSSGVGQSVMAYLQKKGLESDIEMKKAQTLLTLAQKSKADEELRQFRLYGARDYNPVSTAAYMGYENKDKILGLAGKVVDAVTKKPIENEAYNQPSWMASGGFRNAMSQARSDMTAHEYTLISNAFKSQLGLSGDEYRKAIEYARDRRNADWRVSINDIFEDYAKKIGKWR